MSWIQFRMPDHMTMEEGALCEPLAITVHACKRAPISIGQKVLVCGAGTIGLLSMMVARAMGATEICITGKVAYNTCQPILLENPSVLQEYCIYCFNQITLGTRINVC